MKIKNKKLRNGFEIPEFGLGTWAIGGRYSKNFENDKRDIESISYAIDAGITHIDTAEAYADGHAEELIGIAAKSFNRKKLFITSKVKGENLEYKSLIASLKNSLKRLNTDYLDLYLIHWPNYSIAIEETMRAMNDLFKNCLIKYIGVSNFKTALLKKAQSYSKNKIVVNQVFYNLLTRQPEDDGLLNYCQENDVILEAFRPVEKGRLTDESIPVIRKMCRKYGKTPAQIAISWLLSQKNVIAICKMSNPQHLQENLGALGWVLKKEDAEELRNEFPVDRGLAAEFKLR